MKFNFLKKGGEATAAEVKKAEAITEAKKSAGTNRFWMKPEGETMITFLDGGLTDSGLLDADSYWEHQMKLNGHWRNWFPCTQEFEPCPLCESDNQPSMVALFTVLDHSKWKDGKGVVHQYQRQIYSVKRDTFKQLQKIAAKRDGLTGCTFTVSRIGDKAANVGNMFDFESKRTLPEIAAAYSLDGKETVPFDYGDVILYQDAATLRSQGFGTSSSPIGAVDVKTPEQNFDQNL